LLQHVSNEREAPACAFTLTYSAKRYSVLGSPRIRVDCLFAGHNGEERTFEIRNAVTLEVEEGDHGSKSGGDVFGAGSKRVAEEEQEQVHPPRWMCKPKKSRTSGTEEKATDVEFQFAIDPRARNVDMF
jgi:hypothetical protein